MWLSHLSPDCHQTINLLIKVWALGFLFNSRVTVLAFISVSLCLSSGYSHDCFWIPSCATWLWGYSVHTVGFHDSTPGYPRSCLPMDITFTISWALMFLTSQPHPWHRYPPHFTGLWLLIFTIFKTKLIICSLWNPIM